jgi:hypothetical protein
MRELAKILLMIAAATLVFGACGPKTVSKSDAPDWYLNPPTAKDKIYGTGASEQMASVEFAKKVADSNAQQAIAQSIQVSVQSMLRTFLQQSGTMDNARALQFSESVSKQVVNMTLTGVVITKREIKGGKVFSLAEISTDTMKSALLTATRDAAAEYSELKAKSALDALEKEINKGNMTNTEQKK